MMIKDLSLSSFVQKTLKIITKLSLLRIISWMTNNWMLTNKE